MKPKCLTQEYVKECFDYNPETGSLYWRVRPDHHFSGTSYATGMNKRCAGKLVGAKARQRGYPTVNIGGKCHRLHRIIFLWMTGSIPRYVDHINHDRCDNRWDNLRAVSQRENARNGGLSARNSSGHSNVSYFKRDDTWRVQINIGGRTAHVGYFKDIDDAIAAREAAKAKHGYHPNHGFPEIW